MKIFSIFYLLAGVSIAMPMANEDRDWKMEYLEQIVEETVESSKKLIEESNRAIEESNRKTADLYRKFDDKLKEIIENLKERAANE